MAKLMYFAQLAEALGRTSEQVMLPASVGNVQELIDWLGRRDEAYSKALAGGKDLAIMVNKTPAMPETVICNEDEIAFIPERIK